MRRRNSERRNCRVLAVLPCLFGLVAACQTSNVADSAPAEPAVATEPAPSGGGVSGSSAAAPTSVTGRPEAAPPGASGSSEAAAPTPRAGTAPGLAHCGGVSFCPEFIVPGGTACTATDHAGGVVATDSGGNGCLARRALLRDVCKLGLTPAELKIDCHNGGR